MAKLGSVTVNEIELIEVDVSPIVSGIDAADGSIAVLTDGSAFFLKIAGGATSWQAVDKAFVGLANVPNVNATDRSTHTGTQAVGTITGLGALATKNTVATADIDNLAITSAKIGDSQVTSLKIANDAIVTDRILSNSVTNLKLSDMGANTIKGNNTAGVADPIDLTTAQVRTMLTINNVDNTSDANKPVSTAQQTALNGKANLAGGNTFTGAQVIANAVNATANATITPGWSGNTGTWINLDTTGPSGIGSGGPGSNPFIAYVAGGGQWFTDAIAGDVAYRNQAGRLLFGTSPGDSFMRLTGTDLTIGPTGTALTNNPLSVNGNTNNFLQSNVQNTNVGVSASSDVVATANNGDDTTNFVNMGVNSSVYADPSFTINGPNDGYLYAQGGDLSIGTGAANRITFFTGGTLAANEVARITPTGQLAIGVTAPNASAKLQIDSTTQGFLLPRMTSAQRIAIASPAAGLMVYDTNLGCRCIYAGTHWTFEYDTATTAIQTTTSNVYSNITELTTQSLEPGLYVLRFRGIMQSTAATTGVGLKVLNGSATISVLNINWVFSQAGAGTDKNFEYSQLAVGDNVTSASVATANVDFPVAGDGVVRVSAGGTLIIQFRSEVNGSGVSIRPNSSLIFRKVSN